MSNRFFGIKSFALAELMPDTLLDEKGNFKDPLFVQCDDLRCRSDIAGGIIVAKKGKETDLASIPWPFWWFMDPDDPRIAAGAVIHDWLCDYEGNIELEDGRKVHLTSEQCARILAFECMPELRASKWQSLLVYTAVRYFGPKWV